MRAASLSGRCVLGAFVALLAVGCSRGSPPKIAAVVEGAKIRSSDTEALVDAYLHRQKGPDPAEQQAQLGKSQVTKLVLSYQIKVTFLEQLAKRQGVSTEPGSYFEAAADALEPAAYQALGLRPEDFARSLQAGRLSKALAERLFPNVTVSETALREEYDRRAVQLNRNWKAKVKIARFQTEDVAGKVRGRVQAGEPFDRAVSALGAERVDSVDINPITAELPSDTLDAIGALGSGQVGPATQAGSGWISIFVEHREDLPPLSFDDVRPELTAYLADHQRATLFQEWFEKEFLNAHVAVSKHYGRWDPQFHNVS
jgi:hypothetical protein